LEDLLVLSEKGNLRLMQQRQIVEVAKRNKSVEEWGYFPSPSIVAEKYGSIDNVAIEVEQPLWTAGKIDSNIQVAKSQVLLESARLQEVKLSLYLQIVELYSDFLTAKGQLSASSRYRKRLISLKETMARRARAGYSAQVDKSLVEARLSQIDSARINVVSIMARSQQSLSRLVGIDLSTKTLSNLLFPEMAITETFDTLLSETLASNPTLHRIEKDLELARSETIRTKNSVWPTFYVKAQHLLGSAYGDDEGDTRLVFGFNVALGAGLSIKDRILAAKENELLVRRDRKAQVSEIREALQQEWLKYHSSIRLKSKLTEHVSVQERLFNSYRRMFLAGKRSWLDLLNVMREQHEIERSFVNASISLKAAAYKIHTYSIGGRL